MVLLSVLGSHMVNKDLSGHPGQAQLNGNQPYQCRGLPRNT